jgi:hypothetical protein
VPGYAFTCELVLITSGKGELLQQLYCEIILILSRVCGDDYIRRGIGSTTGFIRSQTVTITVYTLYDSQQLSLFSCSEDFGSNSSTNSYGVPCHYSLTGAAPLSNTPL